MPFKNLSEPRRRLADAVYEQLIVAIVKREIGPRDRLIQERLAREFAISRTPVREALLRLEKEGVLSAEPSGGFRLAQIDEEETLQLYQARAAIEGQAARILAARNREAELERLRRLIRKQEDMKNPDAVAYFNANRNIHRAFMEAAGNKFLLESFDMLWSKARAFRLFAALGPDQLSGSLGDHLSLVDAIATGERSHALEAFTDHIQNGYDMHIEEIRREKETSASA